MPFGLVRLLASGVVLLLVAGCGGGSGGGSTGGGGGGNSTTVTFKFNGATPVAAAGKIGSGAFTAETIHSGSLSLSIPNGTTNFALAYACPPLVQTAGNLQFLLNEEFVIEASTADGSTFNAVCRETPTAPQTGTLTASVDASAFPGVSFLNVYAQNGSSLLSSYSGTSAANFSFSAPLGNDRVEVLAFDSVTQGLLETFSLAAARNFSSQAVPGALNGGNPVVLGPADATTSQAITYSTPPSGYSAPSTLVGYEMGGASSFLIADGATTQYPVLPAGAVQSGDFYSFVAATYSSSNPGEGMIVVMTTAGGGPVSVTFPAQWSYAGPTPAALPAFDFTYAGFTGKTGVMQSASLAWSSGTLGQNFFEVNATANYQNGSTTVAFPDLSGLAGFLPAPSTGTNVDWSAEILQNSYGVLQSMPSSAMGSVVENGGTYMVP